jgi:hypothetical protein
MRYPDLERRRYAAGSGLACAPHELLDRREHVHAVRQERRPATPILLGLAHGASAGLEKDRFRGAFEPKTMTPGIGEGAPRPLEEYARVHRGEHAPDELRFLAERGMGLWLQFGSKELAPTGACLRYQAERGRPHGGRASARAARSGLPSRDCEAGHRGTALEKRGSRCAVGKGFPV